MDSVKAHLEREAVGVRRRAVAYIVDLLLVGGGVLVTVNRSKRSLEKRALAFGLLGTVVGLLYHIVFEGRNGRTAGRAVVGIAVVKDDGTRCTYQAAAIRSAFRFVDWLPVGYVIGVFSIQLTERCQRLGDLVANTVIVKTCSEKNTNSRNHR